MIDPRVDRIRRTLMRGQTWRYLRYLHLRESIASIADKIETVAVCGSGHAWAELAIAVEFPHLQITLTDIIASPNYPNYHRAMEFAWAKGVNNVSFSIWDVLVPTTRRFDVVCSTEMLEHIKDDGRAAASMRAAAAKYLYCLVPFADQDAKANPTRRARLLETHGHHVCGYDEADLKRLFPGESIIQGTYWSDAGYELRKKLAELQPEEIDAQFDALSSLAETDLRPGVPVTLADALGIKILVSQ